MYGGDPRGFNHPHRFLWTYILPRMPTWTYHRPPRRASISYTLSDLYCEQKQEQRESRWYVSLADGHSSDSLHEFSSEVSQSLALNLGLTDQQFSVWIEMEMVSFSVLLHCRG